MGDYDDPGLAGRPRTRSRLPVLLAVGALVVGLVAGYLLRAGTEPSAPLAAPTTSAPPVPSTPPAPSGPPSPCVEIAQRGSELVTQLEQAVRAIGALDPAALRVVLDEIRRLRTELQGEVDACRAQVGGTTGPPAPPVPPAPSAPAAPPAGTTPTG